MVDRRALLWFLDLTLAISWPLFLLPLFIPGGTPLARQLTTTGLWTLAMWGPGTAAILTTVLVQKKPLGNLKLNHLGPKRYYLWAWFLPPVLTIATFPAWIAMAIFIGWLIASKRLPVQAQAQASPIS